MMKQLLFFFLISASWLGYAQCDPNKNYEIDAGEDQQSFINRFETTTISLEGSVEDESNVAEKKWIIEGEAFSVSPSGFIELDFSEGEYEAIFEVTFKDGCVKQDQTSLFLYYPLTIPNAFSPNGDGINDSFIILGLGGFPNAQLSIFDVSGLKIYEQIYSPELAWDGTGYPIGSYTYILKLNKGSWEQALTGSITLIR